MFLTPSCLQAWLESHLLETVRLLPLLHSVKIVWSNQTHMGNGPPSAEKLDAELRDLRAVSVTGSRLKEVSYLPDVTWLRDSAGFWYALYNGIFGRVMFLTPRDPDPGPADHLPNTHSEHTEQGSFVISC